MKSAIEPGGPLYLDRSCPASDLVTFSKDWRYCISSLRRPAGDWFRTEAEAKLKALGITYTRGRSWTFYRPGEEPAKIV